MFLFQFDKVGSSFLLAVGKTNKDENLFLDQWKLSGPHVEKFCINALLEWNSLQTHDVCTNFID